MNGPARRITAIVRKESLHILRDWQTLLIVLAMPVLMMFLYGYALTMDISDARVVVEDPSPSPAGRRLADAIDANIFFKVVATVSSARDPATILKRWQAKVIVKLPPGLDADLHDGGSPATVQVLIDGSDQNVGTILINAIQPVLRNAALELVGITPPEPVVIEPRVLYNPEQRSALFFVPGLMAIILIMTSAMLTSLTITREKEYGTMEQLLVSPVQPWEVILGKIAPYILIAAADGVLVLVVGRLFFDVRVQGSHILLAATGTIYVITSLGIGLLFSTIATNQQQAMMMTLPATMMPTVLLSGFIFPLASLPLVLQVIAHAIPATYFLQIIRGIILKGVGLEALWKPIAALTGLGLLFIVMAIRNFRTRL